MAGNNTILFDRSRPDHVCWEENHTLYRIIKNLAATGMEEKEIANVLGVRLASLRQQLQRIPALKDSLIEGKDEATQIMVAQTFKTAIGGQITQEIVEKVTPKGDKTTIIITKEAPPNPLLMMFWLVNRDPENWSSIKQVLKEQSGKKKHGDAAEADKIARLAGDILEGHPANHSREHRVPEETARTPCQRQGHADDDAADVRGETANCLQDNVLDVPAETGTEPV